MKLGYLYAQAIKFANSCDPRPKYRTFSYSDSAILNGNPDTEVTKILVGIDIEVAEILLAEILRRQRGLDLVIAHHPEGRAYASLYKVMQVQVDILKSMGVKKETAQKLTDERMQEVQRRVLPANHTRAVDAAKILGIPFICLHTAADNHVFSFMRRLMNRERPKKVEDIVNILLRIPEYSQAEKGLTGPKIIMGSPKSPPGKILVEMTGGTEGSKEVFDKLYKAGVRTLVSMHLSEEHFKKAKDANLNVVIAGHISSDNLGLNLLLDRLEAIEPLQITCCSGFFRVRRN